MRDHHNHPINVGDIFRFEGGKRFNCVLSIDESQEAIRSIGEEFPNNSSVLPIEILTHPANREYFFKNAIASMLQMASVMPPEFRIMLCQNLRERWCPLCGNDQPAIGVCQCDNDE